MKCMHMVWMIIIMHTFIAHRYYRHTGLKQNGFRFRLRSLVGSALSASSQWTITAASTAGTSWIRVLAWKQPVVGATNTDWCHRSNVHLHSMILYNGGTGKFSNPITQLTYMYNKSTEDYNAAYTVQMNLPEHHWTSRPYSHCHLWDCEKQWSWFQQHICTWALQMAEKREDTVYMYMDVYNKNSN